MRAQYRKDWIVKHWFRCPVCKKVYAILATEYNYHMAYEMECMDELIDTHSLIHSVDKIVQEICNVR